MKYKMVFFPVLLAAVQNYLSEVRLNSYKGFRTIFLEITKERDLPVWCAQNTF